MADLKEEGRIFETNVKKWRENHLGKYVLIKGKEVIGFYSDINSAFKEGSRRFGLDLFFIEKIVPADTTNLSFLGKSVKSA